MRAASSRRRRSSGAGRPAPRRCDDRAQCLDDAGEHRLSSAVRSSPARAARRAMMRRSSPRRSTEWNRNANRAPGSRAAAAVPAAAPAGRAGRARGRRRARRRGRPRAARQPGAARPRPRLRWPRGGEPGQRGRQVDAALAAAGNDFDAHALPLEGRTPASDRRHGEHGRGAPAGVHARAAAGTRSRCRARRAAAGARRRRGAR